MKLNHPILQATPTIGTPDAAVLNGDVRNCCGSISEYDPKGRDGAPRIHRVLLE